MFCHLKYVMLYHKHLMQILYRLRNSWMGKIVEKISSSVASSFIANENELINSVTSTPTK